MEFDDFSIFRGSRLMNSPVRCGGVSKRCGMCSWSKVRRTFTFVCKFCMYFAYFVCFFVIWGGSTVFPEVSSGAKIVKNEKTVVGLAVELGVVRERVKKMRNVFLVKS